MKKAIKLLAFALVLSLLVSMITVISPSAASPISDEYSNLLLNNRDAITKLEMKTAIDVSADTFNAVTYESDWVSSNYENIGSAIDGDTTTCSSTSGFKPTYQYTDNGESKILANLGWIMDLGSKQDLSVYRTYYWTDDGKIDTRKQKGVIYAGDDSSSLEKIKEFNNSEGEVSFDVDLTGVSARYVAVVLTNEAGSGKGFNWYGNLRTFMAEIELYGKEYIPTVPSDHSNLVLNNRNAFTKLEMKTAIDESAHNLNAVLYESEWMSSNYENIGSAIDGDTTTCSSTSGFKPTYQYTDNGENKILANIGWIMDLGSKQDLSVYRTYYWTDDAKIDTRKQKGIIYAGDDSSNLEKITEFNNSQGKVSFDVDLTGVSARYVAVVLTNQANDSNAFNWYTLRRTFMAEIELYGKEYIPAIPSDHSNLLFNNRNAITKLEMKTAIDISADTFNAVPHKSVWTATNYENIGSAIDGDTSTCSLTSGFKPTYQYTEDSISKVFANIGWLMDLGQKQDLSVYRTYYWTDDSKIDTRKQKGVIYAGDDLAALAKITEFDNAEGEVCYTTDLSGVCARYVAVVLTNEAGSGKGFNWYGNLRTFMAEIELYGGCKGDLNNDGLVNIIDLIRLKKYNAKIENVIIDKYNKFMTDYIEDSSRLVALRKFLISEIWHESDINTDTVNRLNWNQARMLSTSQSNIVDANGNTVRLAGVNIPTLNCVLTGDNFWDYFYLAIKEWKCNSLRINLTPQFMPEAEGTEEEWNTYLNIIDKIVYEAVRYDVYVILDNHASDLPTMPVKVDADFWRIIAARYANCPNVIFGLFNEPNCASWNIWKNGNGLPETDSDKIYGMQELVDIIRATGAENLISATGRNNGSSWSDMTEADKLTDGNLNSIMYEIHRYSYDNDFETRYSSVLGQLPLFIGEFNANNGIYNYGDETEPWDLADAESVDFMNRIMQFIDDNNLSFSAYSLHHNYPPMLVNEGYPNYTPTASGLIIKNYIAQVSAK